MKIIYVKNFDPHSFVKIQIQIVNPKLDFPFLWANRRKDSEERFDKLTQICFFFGGEGGFEIRASIPFGKDSKKVLLVSGV